MVQVEEVVVVVIIIINNEIWVPCSPQTQTRSIRSIGTQTDVTNPPLDADLRQHLMLQSCRSTSRSPSDEMERETAAYTAAGLANAASGFGDRQGLNFCLDTLTVEQLKGLCRDKKLAVGGLKRDLVARLASEAAHRTLWRE